MIILTTSSCGLELCCFTKFLLTDETARNAGPSERLLERARFAKAAGGGGFLKAGYADGTGSAYPKKRRIVRFAPTKTPPKVTATESRTSAIGLSIP